MRREDLPAATDSSRFFEYGSAELREVDARTRQASAEVRMPFVLMQSVTPALLGGGTVDSLAVMDPVAVWIPRVTPGRLSQVGAGVQAAHELINRAVQERAQEALRLYLGLSPFLADPADMVPFLPMGTYVTFRYRFRVDDVIAVLAAMEPHSGLAGVPEFQAALASVLHEALLTVERSAVRRLGT